MLAVNFDLGPLAVAASSSSEVTKLNIVVPVEAVIPKAIRISVMGRFGSQRKAFQSAVVSGLLRSPDLVPLPLNFSSSSLTFSELAYHHELLPESTLVLLSNSLLPRQPYSDACLLFLDDKLLLDEDLVLGCFLDCFHALLNNRDPVPAAGNSTGRDIGLHNMPRQPNHLFHHFFCKSRLLRQCVPACWSSSRGRCRSRWRCCSARRGDCALECSVTARCLRSR